MSRSMWQNEVLVLIFAPYPDYREKGAEHGEHNGHNYKFRKELRIVEGAEVWDEPLRDI